MRMWLLVSCSDVWKILIVDKVQKVSVISQTLSGLSRVKACTQTLKPKT